MAWREICGHEFPMLYVQNLLKTGILGHAFLFSGPQGCGKKTFARELASLLNCTHPGQDGSCRYCPSCRLISAGTHPDVRTIDPQDGFLRIDEIRLFTHWLTLQRAMSPYRVGILSDVETMTEEAANCLLKNLEEPPVQSILILITSRPGNLATTLISRCRQIGFSSPSTEEIARYLVACRGMASQQAEQIARESCGKVGEALRMHSMVDCVKKTVEEGYLVIRQLKNQAESDKVLPVESRLNEMAEALEKGNMVGQHLPHMKEMIYNLRTGYDDILATGNPPKKGKKPSMNPFKNLSDLIDRETSIKCRVVEFWRKLSGPEPVLTLGHWLRGNREKNQSLPEWIQKELMPLLAFLEYYLRDAIYYRLFNKEYHHILFFNEFSDDLRQDARTVDAHTLNKIIDQIEDFAEGLSGNPQLDIQSIHFVLTIRRLLHSLKVNGKKTTRTDRM